jgi:hypothetical protein
MDIVFKKVFNEKNKLSDEEVHKLLSSDNINLEEELKVPLVKNFEEPNPDLTADGLPTVEKQLRDMDEKDKEHTENIDVDKVYKREMIQRVKTIALYKMKKNVMMNTFDLTVRERDELQAKMWEYNEVNHKDIIDEFNKIVEDEIFNNKDIDVSKLPIYTYN